MLQTNLQLFNRRKVLSAAPEFSRKLAHFVNVSARHAPQNCFNCNYRSHTISGGVPRGFCPKWKFNDNLICSCQHFWPRCQVLSRQATSVAINGRVICQWRRCLNKYTQNVCGPQKCVYLPQLNVSANDNQCRTRANSLSMTLAICGWFMVCNLQWRETARRYLKSISMFAAQRDAANHIQKRPESEVLATNRCSWPMFCGCGCC